MFTVVLVPKAKNSLTFFHPKKHYPPTGFDHVSVEPARGFEKESSNYHVIDFAQRDVLIILLRKYFSNKRIDYYFLKTENLKLRFGLDSQECADEIKCILS